MFSRNRYDAAKILSVLEVAIVEQFPEYRNRQEVGSLSHNEIAQLPKKRVITLRGRLKRFDGSNFTLTA
jgi:hypothetical protein